jgi:hypothetical protein
LIGKSTLLASDAQVMMLEAARVVVGITTRAMDIESIAFL